MPPKRKQPQTESPQAEKKPAPDTVVPEDVKRFLEFVDKHVLLIAAPAGETKLCRRIDSKRDKDERAFFVLERDPPLDREDVEALSDGDLLVEYAPKHDLVLLDLRPTSYHPLESGLFGKRRVESEDKVIGAYEDYDCWACLLPCPWKFLLKQAASGFSLGTWLKERREHLKSRFSGYVTTAAYDYGFYTEVELFDTSDLEELYSEEDDEDEVDFGSVVPLEFDPERMLALEGNDIPSWKPLEEHNKKTSAVPLSQYLHEAVYKKAKEDIESAIEAN